MVWLVIWIVLMMFWLVFGTYHGWEPARPYLLGNTLIPWACVLILGLIVFGAFPAPGWPANPPPVPR